MSDDLNKIIPAPRSINIKGEAIEIKNLKVGKMSAVVATITPMMGMLPKAGDTPKKNPIDFLGLVLNHTDDVIKLLALLLDKEVEWINDLDVDELVELLSATVEVNLDFFIQKVLPSVSRAMGQLGGALTGTVQTLNGVPPSKG